MRSSDDGHRRGHVERGRERVVARLAAIDVVVRMDRALAAARAGRDLVGAARDHLVDVHVRLGPRAGLPDPERELAGQGAGGDLVGGADDEVALVARQEAKVGIHLGGRVLEDPEGADDSGGHRVVAYREVVEAPLGLRAPVVVRQGPRSDPSSRTRFGSALASRWKRRCSLLEYGAPATRLRANVRRRATPRSGRRARIARDATRRRRQSAADP